MEKGLLARMQYEPCIFMFGNNYRTISSSVLDYSWNSIVTTNCDLGLAAFLGNDSRIVKDVMKYEDMQANIMDSRNLHIIRLFGESCPTSNMSEIEIDDRIDNAVLKLQRMAEVIKRNGIILFEDFEEDYFSHREIRKALKDLYSDKRQLYIFNCKGKDQYLYALEEKGIAVIFDYSINSFFEKHLTEAYNYEFDQTISSNKYCSVYISAEEHQKPTLIDKKLLLETESFSSLLSIELVNGVLIPEDMYKDYFYIFLKNSVREPQWYGYSYGFNIHRKYEEYLYQKTKKGLENIGKQNNKPLLVVGQTGTGKSISLAALSYRIFTEKKYPVIFINNPDVNFASNMEYKQKGVIKTGSVAFNALDDLIKRLENRGAKAVLIVWDTSSYSTGRDKSFRLYQALLSRGRKVYLVSSAYELVNRNSQLEKDYDEDVIMNRRFIECKATVEVSDEKGQLRQILLNKCKIDSYTVDRYMSLCAENGRNYLAMFYQMFEIIRENLSMGVFKEATANLKEIDSELNTKPAQESFINCVFRDALKKIENDLVQQGITDGISDDEVVKYENNETFKDDFIKCIAIGSQFKLKMPYDFALRVLGTYNPQVIKILTRSTFFVVSHDMYDNYEISIRTPLEASMYIEAKSMTVKEEIECIVKLVEMMSPIGGYGHRQEVKYCERLIIIVGPNKEENRNKYKSGYERIIAALKRLRTERGICEPSLISQEITYLREYYGNNEAFELDVRIKALEEAISIADDVLNKSENTGINVGIRNAILVESSNSKLLLCQLNESNDSTYYKEIRRDLGSVIKYDNLNDYAYVTLLKGSIVEYSNERDRIKQLELLESMCTVADEIVFENPDIANSEYFQRKVAEIYSYLEDTSVLQDYIDELIVNGSSAGLYVLSRKRLFDNNVDFKKPIKDSHQMSACNMVYSLFKEDKYKTVLAESESCQYMLLNIIWLINNKEPIYGKGECWITRMREETWKEILGICNNFIMRFCGEGENQRQISRNIRYIKALCQGQLGDYIDSISTLKSIREDSALGLGRVFTKHMLCDEEGKIRKFTGRLGKYDEIERSGVLYIEEFGNAPIYFYGPHMKSSKLEEGIVFPDIEIGYSNISPKAFRNIESGGIIIS